MCKAQSSNIWGIDSIGLFGVGNNGMIMYYNGSAWSSMEQRDDKLVG